MFGCTPESVITLLPVVGYAVAFDTSTPNKTEAVRMIDRNMENSSLRKMVLGRERAAFDSSLALTVPRLSRLFVRGRGRPDTSYSL